MHGCGCMCGVHYKGEFDYLLLKVASFDRELILHITPPYYNPGIFSYKN